MSNADNIHELNPSSHDGHNEKLIAMQKDLEEQAGVMGVRITELDKREKALDDRVGVLESSEVFSRVQELVSEAYTIASAHGLHPPGVLEAIKLMVDARHKFDLHKP